MEELHRLPSCFLLLFYCSSVDSSKSGSLSVRCMIRRTSWISFLISQTDLWDNIYDSMDPVCIVKPAERSCLPTLFEGLILLVSFACKTRWLLWVKLGGLVKANFYCILTTHMCNKSIRSSSIESC